MIGFVNSNSHGHEANQQRPKRRKESLPHSKEDEGEGTCDRSCSGDARGRRAPVLQKEQQVRHTNIRHEHACISIYIYMYICIYVYILIERERVRWRRA